MRSTQNPHKRVELLIKIKLNFLYQNKHSTYITFELLCDLMTPTVAGPIDSYVIAKLDKILLFVINYHRNIKITVDCSPDIEYVDH